MTIQTRENRDYSFLTGLFTGTWIGAGLALCFVPRMAAELRQRVKDSPWQVGNSASEGSRRVRAHGDEAVEERTSHGRHVRDDISDTVVRAAYEGRDATAARTDRVTETPEHSPADRSASTPHAF